MACLSSQSDKEAGQLGDYASDFLPVDYTQPITFDFS